MSSSVSAAPASAAIQFSNIVNGAACGSNVTHRGIDPSNGKSLWDVPVASHADLDKAVDAAQKAFLTWSQSSWEMRQEKLKALSKILRNNKEEMIEILSMECGKPYQFASMEVLRTAENLDFHASVAQPAESVIQDNDELRLTLSYAPMGVVGAICPWNFPLVISIGKIAAGLVTGNCVIVKPSPFTPYSILKLIEWAQAILPPGVLQGLNGDNMLGPLITTHPGIAKISFTGSTATGKKIMEAASRSLKRLTLELGGNDACIVCPDVDVAKVAHQVALGAFFNSGQVCVASKRIFVHQSIYSEFLREMVTVVKSWKVGPASDAGTMLGPVQNKAQYDIVKSYFDNSIINNYNFALGGTIEPSDGYIIHPAIIDNPPDDSMIVTGEPFGPIVPVQPWTDENDLISRVNATTTGLGGSVWTSDVDQGYKLANRIESGTVWINSFGIPLPQAYFAGQKESGIGGELGTQGLLAFCNAKVIHRYKVDVSKQGISSSEAKL